jgi:type VII secretion protein EccB
MPSRQDQLHSYQYSLQRVVAALVTHDPDPSRSPMRRAGTTALVSLLIAAVAVGAVAIYGILTGSGSGKPDDSTAVYVEKGTGARFVVSSDGTLHPVLNFSSALLLATGQEPKVVSTSAKQLAKVPLGATLGIPDAPDSLPGSGSLLKGAWSVCTAETTSATAGPVSTLLVGDDVQAGTDLRKSGNALVVRDPAGETFLVYENRRFLIPDSRLPATLSAIGMNGQPAWPVATAWVNAVPSGPELKAPAIPGFGDPSGVDNLPVGQLVTNAATAGGRATSYSVVLADGISAVTAMQAQLLQTVLGAQDPIALGANFTQLTISHTTTSDVGSANPMPASIPAAAMSPSVACMTRPLDSGKAVIRVDPAIPAGTAVSGATVPGGVQVDQVHVRRGAGAVVISSASPSAPAASGTITLVTDTGLRYSVAGRTAAAKLGYGDVNLPQVPAELVALLPQGPALDPARAAQSTPQ